MNDDPYAALLVKRYGCWSVYIHGTGQAFLGRLVIWCDREDAFDLADATDEEQHELFVVLHTMREALKKAFGATWFNYSFLGNIDRHLHCHLIPRYQEPVEFAGETFVDPDYNQNPYKVGVKKEVSPEVLDRIRDKLKEIL